MLANGNASMAFNSFEELPLIPYMIIDVLLSEETEEVENLWKILKYPTVDALSKPNLTYDEKMDIIWNGDALEQNYNVFLKPLISDSLDSAESQTQLRLYRYNNFPTDNYESIIGFEFDLITNEKTSLVYYKNMLCERTDIMESLILSIFNGRDLKIGSGVLEFSRGMSRACQSLINISNSKSLYGRSLVLALRYAGGESGGTCG